MSLCLDYRLNFCLPLLPMLCFALLRRAALALQRVVSKTFAHVSNLLHPLLLIRDRVYKHTAAPVVIQKASGSELPFCGSHVRVEPSTGSSAHRLLQSRV